MKVVGLLFVATTRVNVSPSLVLELLQRIARVIKDYLGVLNEDSLRKNFVLVYELLDEVIVSFLSCCLFCFINSSWLHVRCSICWCACYLFLLAPDLFVCFLHPLLFNFIFCCALVSTFWTSDIRVEVPLFLSCFSHWYKRNLKKE